MITARSPPRDAERAPWAATARNRRSSVLPRQYLPTWPLFVWQLLAAQRAYPLTHDGSWGSLPLCGRCTMSAVLPRRAAFALCDRHRWHGDRSAAAYRARVTAAHSAPAPTLQREEEDDPAHAERQPEIRIIHRCQLPSPSLTLRTDATGANHRPAANRPPAHPRPVTPSVTAASSTLSDCNAASTAVTSSS